MKTEIEIRLKGLRTVLKGDGTVFLPKYNALLAADLHLGKDASFRAKGVPVPTGMLQSTLGQLSQALQNAQATQLVLLGDLIHDFDSMTDELVQSFARWRQSHSNLSITLVRGNHDRYVTDFPDAWNLETTSHQTMDSIELRHEVSAETLARNECVQIGGHWHPVTLIGRGADRLRLRCFVVEQRSLTLPAFGPFKGGMMHRTHKGRRLYPICEGKILATPISA